MRLIFRKEYFIFAPIEDRYDIVGNISYKKKKLQNVLTLKAVMQDELVCDEQLFPFYRASRTI